MGSVHIFGVKAVKSHSAGSANCYQVIFPPAEQARAQLRSQAATTKHIGKVGTRILAMRALLTSTAAGGSIFSAGKSKGRGKSVRLSITRGSLVAVGSWMHDLSCHTRPLVSVHVNYPPRCMRPTGERCVQENSGQPWLWKAQPRVERRLLQAMPWQSPDGARYHRKAVTEGRKDARARRKIRYLRVLLLVAFSIQSIVFIYFP